MYLNYVDRNPRGGLGLTVNRRVDAMRYSTIYGIKLLFVVSNIYIEFYYFHGRATGTF
jgi:hypothetical protein